MEQLEHYLTVILYAPSWSLCHPVYYLKEDEKCASCIPFLNNYIINLMELIFGVNLAKKSN